MMSLPPNFKVITRHSDKTDVELDGVKITVEHEKKYGISRFQSFNWLSAARATRRPLVENVTIVIALCQLWHTAFTHTSKA